jgi:hypothetical protein
MTVTSLPNATDRVVPLHYFDDTPLWRAYILYSTFVFDCPMDVAKLHASLQRLARKEGWWKIGARLRKNVCMIQALQGSIC